MKHKPLLLLSISILVASSGFSQQVQKFVFNYRCVPTSTDDYSIEIRGERLVLRQNEIILNRKGKVVKVVSSAYEYSYTSKERETIDSIIKVNKLDSIGLYQERVTEWGSLWEVEIQRNSITYKIELPNYTNVGLESLIDFIVCLVPKKQRPRFECKSCK